MSVPVERLSVAFQTDKDLNEYAALGALVEGYGFGTVSVYADLMFQPPLPALLAIAGATRRIRLGPACLNPFTLHPVEIAGQIAVLDAASNSRAYLGLSRGAWLDRVGIKPSRVLTALRESIAIIRHLLRGESHKRSGDVFCIDDRLRLRYPVARTEVPLLIGTWSPRLAGLAGELAAEVKIGGSANPDMVPVMRRWIAAGAVRAARSTDDIGIVLGAVTVVDADGTRARAKARLEVARYLSVVAPLDVMLAIEPELIARIEAAVRADDVAAAGALISDDLLDAFAFAGTPDDIVRHVESIFAAGATRVEFGTPHGLTALDGLHLLGKRVLPHFQ